MRHENRQVEIEIGNEAKNLSCIVVPMKASFFEFVKANFIQDLAKDQDIVDIGNIERVKAPTESHGDAFVEYMIEVTFKAQEVRHTVKVTAYATSSQVMVQPMHEKAGPQEHLGNRGSPRYFVENFLLPWSKAALREKRFNETIKQMYSNAIKEEIKRLDMNKLDLKKSSKSNVDSSGFEKSENVNKTKAKCVAKGCSYQGINPSNRSAVGTCSNCGNFEHFVCVGITSEHKEAISLGRMQYYCSLCFSKNPTIGVDPKPQMRSRVNSLPIMAQGYLQKSIQNEEEKMCDYVIIKQRIMMT